MEKIKLEQIVLNQPIETDFYHKSGILAHCKGEILKQDNIKYLKDNDVNFLIKPGPMDNLSQLLFDLKHETIFVKNLDENAELAQPLFRDSTTLLLDAGKRVTPGMKAALVAQGVEKLFLKRKESELETEKILNYKKAVRIAAAKIDLQNKSVDSIRIDSSKILSSQSQLNTENLERLFTDIKQLDLKPSGDPLAAQLKKRNPFVAREESEKVGYANSFDEIIMMSEDLFNLIRKNDNIRGNQIDDLT
ncbi:MAG TPA: hypothetical protein PK771_15680, partial [Spirochaetota bacterium]|nr:hypothetical protein [Spirochaetota bacterium]